MVRAAVDLQLPRLENKIPVPPFQSVVLEMSNLQHDPRAAAGIGEAETSFGAPMPGIALCRNAIAQIDRRALEIPVNQLRPTCCEGLRRSSPRPVFFLNQKQLVIERWLESLQSECIRPGTRLSLDDALRLVQGYVEHYNHVRLNSAIGYVTPKDMLAGRQQEIQVDRDRRLEAARKPEESPPAGRMIDEDYFRVRRSDRDNRS